MKLAARNITAQHLDRLMRWSMLWLMRIASFILETAGAVAPLERSIEAALKPKIDKLQKLIFALVMFKAGLRLQGRGRPQYRPPFAKRRLHNVRKIFGARLRKLVRVKNPQSRDLRARIAALLKLLSDPEREIRHCARRIRAGLSRRLGGVSRASFGAPVLGLAPRGASNVQADTS